MGRRSALSTQNKLVLYKQILKPVSTYGMQLWGCTKPSNTAIIEIFQNQVFRNIVDASWYVRNADLRRDLEMEMVTAEIRRFARKHEERLLHHDNVEAIQLLDNSELLQRLRRTKPFESWYREQYTQNIGLCNTTTTISCVWSITHDATADTTANKGPMQRKHTNWTG